MCVKLEGIFQTYWYHSLDTGMECHGIKFQKIKKWSEAHETLLDVMSSHQDDVVKKIGLFDESLDTHPSQTEATH